MSVHVKVLAGFFAGAISGYIGHYVSNDVNKESNDQTALSGETDILKYGRPETFPDVAVYKNHALHYDQARKIPLWVAEHITPNRIQGPGNRKHSKFRPDPSVPHQYSAQNKDYWHSGWSRGHMNPAADNKFEQDAMDDSFYLTNVLPQDLKNNADFWNRLEIYCRDLTKKYANVRVISGPLILPETHEDGKKYILHEVIGDNEVSVPTHLYKVVLVESDAGVPQAMASFVVPNADIPKNHPLIKYQVPLEFIEQKSGFQLMPKLSRHNLDDLCEKDGCRLLSSDQFELFFIGRRMENATTLERLEKAWKEIEKKRLKPDEYAENVYNRKKQELSEKESKNEL